MAGTYTQKRVILPSGKVNEEAYVLYPDGRDRVRSSLKYEPSQVTTSFRTGKGESLVSESELSDSNNYLNNLLQTKTVAYDTGHAFSTVKKEAFVDINFFHYYNPSNKQTYHTPFATSSMCSVSDSDWPLIPKWDTAASDGNLAISETYPTKPGVSLAQTVAELKREGLPSLFGSQIASMKGSAARAIGGEFLNSVFGWTPLISDLDKLLKSVVSSSQTIQQMKRDSGRLVRRKHHFPTKRVLVKSTLVNERPGYLGDSGNPAYGLLSPYTVEEVRTTEMWFSGAYTYYLDPGDTLVGQAIMYEQLANKLLGLRLTPETLWELAPWSWLADWYANIGRNITVASAFQHDGLVLKYGYIMRKVTADRIYTYSPLPGHPPRYKRSRLVLRTTSKERVKSSPFGFGLSTSSFTERQWSILGALALTKAPRTLH